MNAKIICCIAIMGVLANAAPLDDEATKNENGEARTLGVVTTGANLAGSALGAAGRVALALVGVAAAVKPLLVLGLGKYALYKWLTNNSGGSGFGVSGGFGGSLANDPQFYSDYDAGYTFSEPAFVDNVDYGSSYVPAEPATPAWRKRK